MSGSAPNSKNHPVKYIKKNGGNFLVAGFDAYLLEKMKATAERRRAENVRTQFTETLTEKLRAEKAELQRLEAKIQKHNDGTEVLSASQLEEATKKQTELTDRIASLEDFCTKFESSISAFLEAFTGFGPADRLSQIFEKQRGYEVEVSIDPESGGFICIPPAGVQFSAEINGPVLIDRGTAYKHIFRSSNVFAEADEPLRKHLTAKLRAMSDALEDTEANCLQKEALLAQAAAVPGYPIETVVLMAAAHSTQEAVAVDGEDPQVEGESKNVDGQLKAAFGEFVIPPLPYGGVQYISNLQSMADYVDWQPNDECRYHPADFLKNLRRALSKYRQSFSGLTGKTDCLKMAWVNGRIADIDRALPLKGLAFTDAFEALLAELIFFVRVKSLKSRDSLHAVSSEMREKGITLGVVSGELEKLVVSAVLLERGLAPDKGGPKLSVVSEDIGNFYAYHAGRTPIKHRAAAIAQREHVKTEESDRESAETAQTRQERKAVEGGRQSLNAGIERLTAEIAEREKWEDSGYPDVTYVLSATRNSDKAEITAQLAALRALKTRMETVAAAADHFIPDFNALATSDELKALASFETSSRFPAKHKRFVSSILSVWQAGILPTTSSKRVHFEATDGSTVYAGDDVERVDPTSPELPQVLYGRRTKFPSMIMDEESGQPIRLVDRFITQWEAAYQQAFNDFDLQAETDKVVQSFVERPEEAMDDLIAHEFPHRHSGSKAEKVAVEKAIKARRKELADNETIRSQAIANYAPIRARSNREDFAQSAGVIGAREAYYAGKKSVLPTVIGSAHSATVAVNQEEHKADMAEKSWYEPASTRKTASKIRDGYTGAPGGPLPRSRVHEFFYGKETSPKVSKLDRVKPGDFAKYYRQAMHNNPSPVQWLELVAGSLGNYIQTINDEKKTTGRAKANQDMAIAEREAILDLLAKYPSLSEAGRAAAFDAICARLLAVDTSKSGSFNGKWSRFRKLMDEVKTEAQGYHVYHAAPGLLGLNIDRLLLLQEDDSLRDADLTKVAAVLAVIGQNSQEAYALNSQEVVGLLSAVDSANLKFKNKELKAWAKRFQTELDEMRSVTWAAELSPSDEKACQQYQRTQELDLRCSVVSPPKVGALRGTRAQAEGAGQQSDVVLVKNPVFWLVDLQTNLADLAGSLTAKEQKQLAVWTKKVTAVRAKFNKAGADEAFRHTALQAFAREWQSLDVTALTGMDYAKAKSATQQVDWKLAGRHAELHSQFGPLFNSAKPYAGKKPALANIHTRNRNRFAMMEAVKAARVAEELDENAVAFPENLTAIQAVFGSSPTLDQLTALAPHANTSELQKWLKTYVAEVISAQNVIAGLGGDAATNTVAMPVLDFSAAAAAAAEQAVAAIPPVRSTASLGDSTAGGSSTTGPRSRGSSSVAAPFAAGHGQPSSATPPQSSRPENGARVPGGSPGRAKLNAWAAATACRQPAEPVPTPVFAQ